MSNPLDTFIIVQLEDQLTTVQVNTGIPGTVWYNGAGTPSNTLGSNSDYYLETSNGDVYEKVLGSWGSPIFQLSGGGGGGGYNLIEEEGLPLTQRTTLNFIGSAITATDDSVNMVTKVTLSQSPSGSASVVGTGRLINTTSPLTGGGDLSADRTIAIPVGNLTDAGTDGITVTGGTGAVIGSGTSISQHVADATHSGYLATADWNIFNNKQPTLTTGNLTDVGTDGIVVTGGTGSVIGSGTSIAQHVADTTHNGYLTSTDWNTFNNKQSTITTGNLTDVGTDGITVTGGTGAVVGSGTSISQHVADTTHAGYLASTDWNTFNGKQASLTNQGTTTTVLHGNASGVPSFGAVVLTTDVSGVLPLANGGTSQASAAAARGPSGLNIDQRTTVADTNYNILATDRYVGITSITAARILSLPAASAMNAGQELIIEDESGSVSGTNTVTINRAGSDTINGVASMVMNTGRGKSTLISNGSNAWVFGVGALVNLATGVTGTLPTANGGTGLINADILIGTLGITIDGGGSTPATGSKGFYTVTCPGTLTNWYLAADQSGSCAIDVNRSGTSIVGGGNTPTLSSAQSGNAAISGWTSATVSAGDIIEFKLTSATTITRVNLVIKITKT